MAFTLPTTDAPAWLYCRLIQRMISNFESDHRLATPRRYAVRRPRREPLTAVFITGLRVQIIQTISKVKQYKQAKYRRVFNRTLPLLLKLNEKRVERSTAERKGRDKGYSLISELQHSSWEYSGTRRNFRGDIIARTRYVC